MAPAPLTVHTRLGVSGMTCEHCVRAVTEALQQLDGVTEVRVALAPGGESGVDVTSAGPLQEDAVRAAVDEAGYDVATLHA